MMRHVLDFFIGSPIPLAVVGAHFLFYSLLAWCVLLARAVSGRFSVLEWMLFALFGGCLILESIQLAVGGFRLFGEETWGFSRYFGVFAPLLWVWAAYAVAEIWSYAHGWRRMAARGGVAAALLWIFVSQNLCSVSAFYNDGARYDAVVAAKRIERTIRCDYAGPRRQKKAKRTLREYYTTLRPVVFGDFAAAAWQVRGQSEGALQGEGKCPYPDDYLFVRVGSGYGGIETVDTRLYDYVRSVRGGLGSEWRLFRRKTTPHRQAAIMPIERPCHRLRLAEPPTCQE